MRTGILTFINTVNYGALLQAYALQEIVKSFGGDVEIIRYQNQFIRNKELNTGKKITPRYIYKKLIMGRGIKQKYIHFKEFENKYINYSEHYNAANIHEAADKYDFFITGSDQVWNMDITHNDWNYFLSFVNNDKTLISYAPSFGNVKFPKDKTDLAVQYLKRFNYLSVREAAGRQFIKLISNLDAEVVVDPTLLLSKSEWESKIEFKPKEKHYILVYFPHNKALVFDFVKKLSKKTGCKIIYLSISPRVQFGIKTIYDASPDEFLGWIKHADYVVTGSFHGTAFSINLEKQFFYEPSGEGSRIDNLVTICGLKDRSILNNEAIDKEIDYADAKKRLNAERIKSLEWLKESLMGEHRRYE